MTKLLTWDTALTLLPTWILNMLIVKLRNENWYNSRTHSFIILLDTFPTFFYNTVNWIGLLDMNIKSSTWEFKTIILFEAIILYYPLLSIVLSYFAEHCVIWRGVWVRQFFRFFAAVAVWGLTGCVWGQAGTSPTDHIVSPPAVELSPNLLKFHSARTGPLLKCLHKTGVQKQ